MKRDKIINLRVTAEEKAAIIANAGSVGVAAYLRQLGLGQSPPVPNHAESSPAWETPVAEEPSRAAPASSAPPSASSVGSNADSTGTGKERDSLPAPIWGARVRQLCLQGLPRMAAERIADQEFRGR